MIVLDKYDSIDKETNQSHSNLLISSLKNLEELKNLDIKRTEIEFTSKRLEYLSQEYSKWYLIFNISCIIGLIMCSFGFVYWYFKSQIYIDYNLKKDAIDKGFKYEGLIYFKEVFWALILFISLLL